MHVGINVWAVLVAGASSMIIGAVYYSDAVLGKEWKKIAKIDEVKFQKQMPKVMPLIFLGALITSYVVAYISYIYHSFFAISWLGAGIETALILWLGLGLTTLSIHGLVDQKPYKGIIISTGNRLLSILTIGLIIGWLHP